MAKIITVGTLKGGTGKTTITFNLAGILAEKHRVLLIDVDAQGNLSSDVGVDVAIQNRKSLRDVFENSRTKPEEVIIREPIKGLPGLDIIPSHIKLQETDMRLANRAGREQILANWLEDKANKKSDALKKGEFWGLTLFVGIPLPGTGAWTGSLIAALLGLKPRSAIPCIMLGVLLAAAIMTALTYGVIWLI